jgi:hypothetical protein
MAGRHLERFGVRPTSVSADRDQGIVSASPIVLDVSGDDAY